MFSGGSGIADVASDYDLMKIHVATLFACDADGGLRYVREPGDPHSPPRFFMGRTLQGNVWHFRHDLPDELRRELEQFCRSEPVAENLMRPSLASTKIRAALQADAPITQEERGPTYWIPETVQAPKDIVLITKGNGHILQAGFPWLLRRILDNVDVGPVAAVVVQGTAASACYCAQLSPAAAEAGVATMESMRGRGYATAAVAGWAAAIVERGLLPLYSTTWENVASQQVAHKLGMLLYGEDWTIG